METYFNKLIQVTVYDYLRYMYIQIKEKQVMYPLLSLKTPTSTLLDSVADGYTFSAHLQYGNM